MMKRYRNCLNTKNVFAKECSFKEFREFVVNDYYRINSKTMDLDDINKYDYKEDMEGYCVEYSDRYHFIRKANFEKVYRKLEFDWLSYDDELEELKGYK